MKSLRNIFFIIFILSYLLSFSHLQAQTSQKLFSRDANLSRKNILDNPTGGAILILEEVVIQEMIQSRPEEVTLVLPDELNGELTLILKKRKLYTDDFRVTSNGNTSTNIGTLDLHYIGFVRDQPSSRVALSLTDKEVSGLIQLESKTIAIRRLQVEIKGEHVIYNYENRPTATELDCSSTDDMEGYKSDKLSRTSINPIAEPVCFSVRVEVDKDFKGNAPALMNQVANIYQTIGVNMLVSEIYYWNDSSPYSGTSKEIITKLQANLATANNLSGDLTVFLSGKGNGGRASSVGQICDPAAVCYSGQNDDVYTVAHEIAHLLSAHHTHACKWNGNYTAIDGCGYNAGYGGCPGEDPVGGGTIMSYCHIRSVGVNMVFHPQVAEAIYTFLKEHSDCTCAEVEESVEVNGATDNIVANICELTITNPEPCAVDLYTMIGNIKGNLMLTIPPSTNNKTPIINGATYGLYSNGILIEKFVGNCGNTKEVPFCGEEEMELEDTGGGNIIANLCEVTISNTQTCSAELYAINGDIKDKLMLTIAANTNAKSPIIQGNNYGLYVNGTLIERFLGTCGKVVQVASCGIPETKVLGKVMLEGFYDSYSGAMHQNLSKQNVLPKENPYLKSPWNYKGVSSVSTLPPAAVDWILLMSRDKDGKILSQAVGFVSTTGFLLDVQGNQGIALANSVGNYLSVHHRGHMAVMSSKPYTAGTSYDFTNNVATVMGNGQLKLMGTKYALYVGDYDANGVINNQDYNQWVVKSSLINQYLSTDGDGNGIINNKDYNLWIANRSKIGHIPLHY